MKAVILAAGSGERLGRDISKPLIDINGKTLLRRCMEPWVEAVDGFVFVVRHKEGEVAEEIGKFGVAYELVEQKELKGEAHALMQARDLLTGSFVVVLGDCLIQGFWTPTRGIKLGLGVWNCGDAGVIKENYGVKLDRAGYIEVIVNKPKVAANGLCGLGIYFLDERIFKYLGHEPAGGVGIANALMEMIYDGCIIKPVFLSGVYVNVNEPKDLEQARGIWTS